MISNQIAGMALVFGLAQLIKYFDLANNKNALVIRILYGTVQIFTLAMFAFIRSQIMKQKGKNSGHVTIVTPPHPFSGEEAKTERITIEDYDNRELFKMIQSTVFGALLLIVIHVWLGSLQPLIFQSILPLKTLFTANLFQIYVLKKKAEGKLERPWKEASPFADLFQLPPEGTPRVEDDGEPTGIVELNDEEDDQDASSVEQPKQQSVGSTERDNLKKGKEEEQPLLKQRNISSKTSGTTDSNSKKGPRKDD